MTSPKKPGLRVLIYQLIKEKRGQKIHSGEIERFGEINKYKASTADRRARDLVEEFTTIKGVRKPNPYYCPEIKSIIENKCAVYWYEEKESQKDPSIFRCHYCPKTAVTFKGTLKVCTEHSKEKVVAPSLF